jgi:hypothetical protein
MMDFTPKCEHSRETGIRKSQTLKIAREATLHIDESYVDGMRAFVICSKTHRWEHA